MAMTFSFITTTICSWVTCYLPMLRLSRLFPSMAGSNKATMSTNQVINGLNGDDHYDSSPKKKPVKKDRHSKIYTSQGPRDRRVRLSIGIARKFFDLQDMLGFDKASKTLDWLFIKSKTAINALEAEQMKHSCSGGSKSLSSASECEVVSGTNEAADNGDPSGIVFKEEPIDER
ncbi:hypothetical protein F0562_004252 [Nyssa sinensis]|uniref:TCP domain-containing protein n=1 Tax=Nyssa sinensis TaxID=561372 RepID=A0A5J5BXC6_9ASTE|nr:hypothetical protein F0562_004252 [Nyssa sinensis]